MTSTRPLTQVSEAVVEAAGAGVTAAVDVTLLSRFYERFADHAVEVARRVIFQVTGRFSDDDGLPTIR